MKIDFLFKKLKHDRFWVVLSAAALALTLAYFAEIVIGLAPCSLCILQRIPYFILLLLSIAAILKPDWSKAISFLVITAGVAELLLAGYHIGIEHYIFTESYVCQVIRAPGVASSCSQVHFRFMNLSMAEWNLIYIAGLLYYFIKNR